MPRRSPSNPAATSPQNTSPDEGSNPFALDPDLHAATLASVARTALATDPPEQVAREADEVVQEGHGEGDESNPLTSFAQHVLRGNHLDHLDHHDDSSNFLGLDNEGEEIFTQPPAQGFAELLESDAHRRAGQEGGEVEQGHGPLGDGGVEGMEGMNGHDANGGGEGSMAYGHHQEHERAQSRGHGHEDMGEAPPPPERTRRGKRRREEDESSLQANLGADGEAAANGEGLLLDPVRLKKDSHVSTSPATSHVGGSSSCC